MFTNLGQITNRLIAEFPIEPSTNEICNISMWLKLHYSTLKVGFTERLPFPGLTHATQTHVLLKLEQKLKQQQLQ